MSDERAKVVIIGAGFGGIEAAKSLRRAPVEITVLDRQNHSGSRPSRRPMKLMAPCLAA